MDTKPIRYAPLKSASGNDSNDVLIVDVPENCNAVLVSGFMSGNSVAEPIAIRLPHQIYRNYLRSLMDSKGYTEFIITPLATEHRYIVEKWQI